DGAENWFRRSGYAYPFNVTGQPALSIPMGACPQGMPMGLQLVGLIYHDDAELRLGEEIEALLTPPPPSPRCPSSQHLTAGRQLPRASRCCSSMVLHHINLV